jgi:uncharacterized protein (DUF111 family)
LEGKAKLYIDPEAGIAGDIFTAALISMGAPEELIVERMERAAQKQGEAKVEAETTTGGGLRLKIDLHSREIHLEEERSKQILEELFEEFHTGNTFPHP